MRERELKPDEAKVLLAHFLPTVSMEWDITKKVLSALPSGNLDYRPDPKARTAAELAWHIVSSEVWFLEALTKGEFSMEEKNQPPEVSGIAGMIEWYESSAAPLMERLKASDPEALARPISFFGLFNHPAITYMTFLLGHSVHHRGQLATYLRPMGGSVPAIYGGSADEPFEIPS